MDILSALLSASLSTFVAMSTFEFIPPFDEIEVDKIEVVEKGTNTVIQYGTDCLDENRAFLSNKIDPLTDRIESLIDNTALLNDNIKALLNSSSTTKNDKQSISSILEIQIPQKYEKPYLEGIIQTFTSSKQQIAACDAAYKAYDEAYNKFCSVFKEIKRQHLKPVLPTNDIKEDDIHDFCINSLRLNPHDPFLFVDFHDFLTNYIRELRELNKTLEAYLDHTSEHYFYLQCVHSMHERRNNNFKHFVEISMTLHDYLVEMQTAVRNTTTYQNQLAPYRDFLKAEEKNK